MKKLKVILRTLGVFLALGLLDTFATAAELELVTEVPSPGYFKISHIEALEILDSSPNEIVFVTQNEGAGCWVGTPVYAWKLVLDPDTGDVLSLEVKQSLSNIQSIRQALFESSNGTLFTGGGWCGPKPPYYSIDGGETWQPATSGDHPPNSTFSFVEFNGDVYAGTGYEPYHGQVYRWLGEDSPNHWELVFDIAPPRSIVDDLEVFENKIFVPSIIYWYGNYGCEVSVPVYVSTDGNTYKLTTGIPPCYTVPNLLVVGDKLIATTLDVWDSTSRYLYLWNESLQKWEETWPYELCLSKNCLVSHNAIIYAYGKTSSDVSKGIYKSTDTGQNWLQIAILENPDVSFMTVHDDILYIGTRADANKTAYIHKIQLNQPPQALCQDVTVPTEPGLCEADASIDDGSFDPDEDEITLEQAPPGPYDLGDTDVTLTVTDDKGASDTCEAKVTVVDEESPDITLVSANPDALWPPNHKMVPVVVAVNATDNCNSEPVCQIISVVSNEPVNGLGDGNTAPDWVITGDLTVKIRAERSGKGSGRIYTITVDCADPSGNSSTGTATVTVPHDKGKKNQTNKKKK